MASVNVRLHSAAIIGGYQQMVLDISVVVNGTCYIRKADNLRTVWLFERPGSKSHTYILDTLNFEQQIHINQYKNCMPLRIITKSSILDIARVLNPLLIYPA